MDIVSQPLIILSICIGALNIIERILRRTSKYNRLLDKVHKSKEKLITLSHHRMSIDTVSEEDIILDALGFIEEIIDLTDIDFKIPD